MPPPLRPMPAVTHHRDPAKAQAVQDLFQQYNDSLASSGTFPPAPAAEGEADSRATESPQTRVWVLYFLAQHYDYLG